jgi:hypothetical protein
LATGRLLTRSLASWGGLILIFYETPLKWGFVLQVVEKFIKAVRVGKLLLIPSRAAVFISLYLDRKFSTAVSKNENPANRRTAWIKRGAS